MKLPNAEIAVVEREKLVEYLLNPAHRYGASKARFFLEHGFRLEAWSELAEALRRHARQHEVRRVKQTGFGPRFEIDGELTSPGGRKPWVRTVWQADEGRLAPRLITAYPVKP